MLRKFDYITKTRTGFELVDICVFTSYLTLKQEDDFELIVSCTSACTYLLTYVTGKAQLHNRERHTENAHRLSQKFDNLPDFYLVTLQSFSIIWTFQSSYVSFLLHAFLQISPKIELNCLIFYIEALCCSCLSLLDKH